MQSEEKNGIIIIRLFLDENVNEQLKKVCNLYNIKNAVILSGIGQLKKAKLGYFSKKGNYAEENFNKPLEILSLTGNICKEGDDYVLHLHSVLGDEKKNAIGGHFIEGEISITGEIVILTTNFNIDREYNEKTGLKDLIFR
jgi:predicted DNA-binding protein with PD1-like motif